MPRLRPINPDHTILLWSLRVIGFALAVPGAVMLAIGVYSFISAFGKSGPPDKFWLVFVGGPMLGIGGGLLKFSFMGKITRFMAQEVTPVGVDSFRYAAEASRGSVRDLAHAVRRGLGAQSEGPDVHCADCGETNKPDARFCHGCGARLALPVTCAGCGHENPKGARFCNSCGKQQ